MGVLKSRKRKIICNDEEYYWYIAQDDDSECYLLEIVSNDKQLVLTFPLNMTMPYIISKGKMFQGQKTNGRWNRYLLPFSAPESITPQFVSEIISWAAGKPNAENVEWKYLDKCNGYVV